MPDRNITFEIKEHLGIISRYDSRWNKELNIISWNGAPAKFDIRDWDEHHERMSRGITLSQWEMRKMVDLYVMRNNDRAVARGRALEAERNARREAAFKQREEREETSQIDDVAALVPESEATAETPLADAAENAAETEAYEGAIPPTAETEAQDAQCESEAKFESEKEKEKDSF